MNLQADRVIFDDREYCRAAMLRAPNIMKHTLRCHGFGSALNVAWPAPRNPEALSVKPRAKTAPALKGLRPESALALSLGLPICQILAAPRFAPLPILARNARAFHYVRGSKGDTGGVG